MTALYKDRDKIKINKNDQGRPTGEATVHLVSKSDLRKALAYDRQYLRERFVIVETVEPNKDFFEFIEHEISQKEKELECPMCLDVADVLSNI